MKMCDYCDKAAEYDGQPHGIEDCAEHLRLENEQLRAMRTNIEGLIPYWQRLAAEAEAHPNGVLMALFYRGAIEAVRMAIEASCLDSHDERV